MRRQVMKQMILIITCLVFALALSGTVAAEDSQGGGANNLSVTDDNGYFEFNTSDNKTHVLWIQQNELPEEYRDSAEPEKVVMTIDHNTTLEKTFANLKINAQFMNNKINGTIFNINGTAVNGIKVHDPPQIKILAIGGDATVKSMLVSAKNIIQEHPEVTFKLRAYTQVSDDEIKDLLSWADIMYLGTMSFTTKLLQIVQEDPQVLAGKTIYSGTNLEDMMSLSSINGVKIFDGFIRDQISSIYSLAYGTDPLGKLDNLSTQYPSDALIQHWIYCRKCDSNGLNVDYYNLFNYLLNKHTNDDNYKYSAVIAQPDNFIYWNGKIYTTFDKYQQDYPIDPNKPTAGILYPYSQFTSDSYLADELANKLKNKGFNVIIVVGKAYAPYLTGIQNYFIDSQNNSRIDVMVDMVSFWIGAKGGSVDTINLFEQLNVPILTAMITQRTLQEWYISDQGLPLTEVYYRISEPEMQGVTEPILLAASNMVEDPLTGAILPVFTIIGERANKIVERAWNWVQLQKLPNSEKKIALIYYSHDPGKASIGAYYLNLAESIINILERLKAEGYTVGEIPENADELIDTMLLQGINVANWAPGELEKLANNPNVILWPVEEYEQWFAQLNPLAQKQMIEGPVGYIEELVKIAVAQGENNTIIQRIDKWQKDMEGTIKDLTDSAKLQSATLLLQQITNSLNEVVKGNNSAWDEFYRVKNEFYELNIPGANGWGQPPGDQMVIEKDGKKYFIIPGLMIGNIFICPEPLVGNEYDDKLYHSQVFPPPHQFFAVYAWIENVYKANAEVHVGKHARYEWKPVRQTALSDQDYPEIAIGNVPSPYIYIMDNSEMQQAKRRGLSVIIDHLTSPLKMTDLYGPLLELKNFVNDYQKSIDEDYRTATAEQINELVKANNFDQEMNIDLNNITNDGLVEAVDDYLIELQETLMPFGLHTFGEDWPPEEIAMMVSAMLSQDSADYTSLPGLLAAIQGKDITTLSSYDRSLINTQALEICNLLVNGTVPQQIAANLTSNSTLQTKLNKTLGYGVQYTQLLIQSPKLEMDSLIDSLNGGYITPRPLGDPVTNPTTLPTGANAYGLDPSKIPTKAAYLLGSTLANMTLTELGKVPEKIAVILFSVETSRDDGANVAFVLNMMGIKLKYSSSGSRTGLELIPLSELGRPRVDVVITTSGLFRDIFGVISSDVLDRAARLALAASYNTIIANNSALQPELDKTLATINAAGILVKGNDPLEMNYIAKHWVEMVNKGYTGDLAITRVFAPPVGTYGTKLPDQVGKTWTWEDREELAKSYMTRMSNAYTETQWGVPQGGVFEEVLRGVEYTFHTRNSNLGGLLDTNDWYQFQGGLTMAAEYVNGKAPEMYILNYADRNNVQVETVEHFINRELRTRYFNPEYIKAMMNEGYAGVSKGTFDGGLWNNLWGWQVTAPQVVNDRMWNEMVDVYLRDKYNIGVTQWMSTGNRAYIQIELTGTLLTAAHKGYWKPDSATLNMVATKWAQLIADNGVACCDCSCGNIAMMEWASQYVNPDLLSQLNAKLYEATQNAGFAPSPTPSQPEPQSSSQPQPSGSTSQSASQSSGVAGESGEQSQSEESASPGEQGEAKAYEVTKEGNSGTSDSGLPAAAIIGVVALVCLIGFGYFRMR